MTIKLPPLPEPAQPADAIFYIEDKDMFTSDQLRSAQREAALMALEEAARVCERLGMATNGMYERNHECAVAIRALRTELENTK